MTDTTRLLIVENDPNDLELIQLALGSCPFAKQMDIAEDGEAALQYLLGQSDLELPELEQSAASPPRPLPRLVLLDLKLPKIDGIQVLETIRQHPRTHHLVVVVLTSSAEEQDIAECYNLGVNSYVVKPLDFQQFQDVAQQVGTYWMQLNYPTEL